MVVQKKVTWADFLADSLISNSNFPKFPNLLYFDLGNNFPEPSEQGDLKIQLIQTGLTKISSTSSPGRTERMAERPAVAGPKNPLSPQ